MWKFSIVYAVIAKHDIYLYWLILFYVLLTSVFFFCLKFTCVLFYLCVSYWHPQVSVLKTWYWTYTYCQMLYTELSLYICVFLMYQENCIDVWNIELYITILCLEAQLNSTIYSSNLFECIFLPGVKLRRLTFMPSLFRNVSYITSVCGILLHPDLCFYGNNYMIFLYLLM